MPSPALIQSLRSDDMRVWSARPGKRRKSRNFKAERRGCSKRKKFATAAFLYKAKQTRPRHEKRHCSCSCVIIDKMFLCYLSSIIPKTEPMPLLSQSLWLCFLGPVFLQPLSMSQKIIDHSLRSGGNELDSALKICVRYKKHSLKILSFSK